MQPDNKVEIIQDWNQGQIIQCPPDLGPLYSSPPRIGLVIGTFAAVPYIHLQLEARRRLFPHIPLLVHDDGSHQAERIAALCCEYDCDFEHNSRRQPPCIGDVSAFVGGLAWARQRSLDIVLKVSRRWIFLNDWSKSLSVLAEESQYATFSSYTTSYNFGFRTECLGLSVARWSAPEFLRDTWKHFRNGTHLFVEAYLHDFARQFEKLNCPRAQRWQDAHPMPNTRTGYAVWTLMGTDRCERSPYFLWHDAVDAQDYQRQAESWGLNYSVEDFSDPDQGAGDRLQQHRDPAAAVRP